MKKRYLYMLIFCIPAFLVSLIASILLFGGILGMLWIFVFGDDPWPQGIDLFLLIPFILAFMGIWITLLTVAYKAGKAAEADIESSTKRVTLIACGVTVLLLLFMVMHQWQIGNIGPKPNSSACADFCLDNGYSASMVSPQAYCNCLGSQAQIAIQQPMSAIRASGY